MSIESLPVELISHTIALADCPRTVWSALLTCKHFSSAARKHVVPSVWQGFSLARVLGRHWGTGKCTEQIQLNMGVDSTVQMTRFHVQTVCKYRADKLYDVERQYDSQTGALLHENDWNSCVARSWFPEGVLRRRARAVGDDKSLIERWNEDGLQVEWRYWSFATRNRGCSTDRSESVSDGIIHIVKATEGVIDGDVLRICAIHGTVLEHTAPGSTNDCATAYAGQLAPTCLHAGAPNCVSCTEYQSIIFAQRRSITAAAAVHAAARATEHTDAQLP